MSKSPYIFSGHQTFVLRASWMKRLYDVLGESPQILTSEDAVVQLGVGKNMVDAMRYWAIVTNMIAQREDKGWQATEIAHRIFAHDGIDPFVVLPWTRWWLHWQLIQSSAFTWQYLFMHMNGTTIDIDQCVHEISALLMRQNHKIPATAVLRRDIQCAIRCYVSEAQTHELNEDVLMCPLLSLGLMQVYDNQVRLVSDVRDDLPDALVVAAIADAMQRTQQHVMPFAELMWGIHGPGRMFRLTEDALLERVVRLEYLTQGAATFSDHAGVRAVQWSDVQHVNVQELALHHFAAEVRV